MNSTSILMLAGAIFFSLATVAFLIPRSERKRGKSNLDTITGRRPLTENEQSMYFRLVEALPEHIVLAQVSFAAIMDSSHFPTRGTFNQKTADFVICDKSFRVLACVELDDSSHDGRKERDARRDALLEKAGYRVLRYRRIPDKVLVSPEIASLKPALLNQ